MDGSKVLMFGKRAYALIGAVLLAAVLSLGLTSCGDSGSSSAVSDSQEVTEGKAIVSSANSELLFVEWELEEGVSSVVVSSDDPAYEDFISKVESSSGVDIESIEMTITVTTRSVATNAGTDMEQISYRVSSMEATTPTGTVIYNGGSDFEIQ